MASNASLASQPSRTRRDAASIEGSPNAGTAMHTEIMSFPDQLRQLLHSTQENTLIRRHRSVRNRHVHKVDTGCFAFQRLTTQPKLIDFFVRQHGHKNVDALLRQRTNLVAEPVIAARASHDSDPAGGSSGNRVCSGFQEKEMITGEIRRFHSKPLGPGSVSYLARIEQYAVS
jgi:hypothetical protein